MFARGKQQNGRARAGIHIGTPLTMDYVLRKETLLLLAGVFCLGTGDGTQFVADVDTLESHLRNVFTKPRPVMSRHNGQVRTYMHNYFQDLVDRYPDITYRQQIFTVRQETAINYILIFPGVRWGSSTDRISCFASRYDTLPGTAGVDSNGSGIVALLEVARMLAHSSNACYRVNSIILVALDMESDGAYGSKAFVDHYLVPDILQAYNIPPDTYAGAIIADSIMNYDDSPQSQYLPEEMQAFYATLQERLQNEGMQGNFLTTLGRMDDIGIANTLLDTWLKVTATNERSKFVLHDIPLPLTGRPTEIMMSVIPDHLNSLLDISTQWFWQYSGSYSMRTGLKSLYLTDTGSMRGILRDCESVDCDDERLITPDNLQFLATVTDTIFQFLLKLATEDGEISCLNYSTIVHLAGSTSRAQRVQSLPAYLLLPMIVLNGLLRR